MKNIFIIIFIFGIKGYSQNTSFGILTGINAYDIETDGELRAGNIAYSGLNIGIFGEYKINESIGVKLYGIYNTTSELQDFGIGPIDIFDNEVELKTFQAHLLTKYDVNKDYKKGFYLTGGFRLTSILSEKVTEDKELLEGFYKKSNFGILLGFGVDFLESFSVELLIDRNLTNTLDNENNRTKNYGVYLNLLFDVNSLISKN